MQTNNKPASIERTLKFIHYIEDGLLAVLLLSMLLLASSQIFLRNLLEVGVVWADPLLRIMVLWIGLLGALAASRDNKHIAIDALTRFMSTGARKLVHVFTSLFTVIVSGLIAYHSIRFELMEYETGNLAAAGVPAWLFEIIIPIAFSLITLRFSIHFIHHLRALRIKEASA